MNESQHNLDRQTDRNYGIDLLRIVSMIMIVVLHTLGHGKLLESVDVSSGKYWILWLMETMAYCAVNCYGLISGYVGYGKKFKLRNIIQLWIEVLFYSVSISIAFKVFYGWGIRKVIFSFFPLLLNQYWYFSAYFLMFFFTPIFNYLVKSLSKKQATIFLGSIVLLFSAFQIFAKEDLLSIKGGYTALWLSVLYIIGAYLKKYNTLYRLKKRWLLLSYSLCVFISYGYKFIMEISHLVLQEPFKYLSDSNRLISYSSPTILLCGISLLLVFSKIQITKCFIKGITILASLTFAVYLIHDNHLVKELLMPNLSVVAKIDIRVLPFAVIGIVFSIWFCCSLLDFVRDKIFKLIRVKQFSIILENKLQLVADSLILKINGKLH